MESLWSSDGRYDSFRSWEAEEPDAVNVDGHIPPPPKRRSRACPHNTPEMYHIINHIYSVKCTGR